MANMPFNTAAFGDFDGGKLRKLIDRELKRAVEDCIQRPGDDRARKVVLQFDFLPQADDTGDVDAAGVGYKCRATLPAAERTGIVVGVNKNATLFYNDLSPDNPFQRTIDQDLPPEEAGDGKPSRPR